MRLLRVVMRRVLMRQQTILVKVGGVHVGKDGGRRMHVAIGRGCDVNGGNGRIVRVSTSTIVGRDKRCSGVGTEEQRQARSVRQEVEAVRRVTLRRERAGKRRNDGQNAT